MKWKPKEDPAVEARSPLALGTREVTASDKIVPQPGVQVKYPTRYLIGFLDGKGVYAPLHAPSRGLAIEEDWSYLRVMTPEEVLSFACQIDRDMATYLLIAEAEHKRHLLEREIEADAKRAEEKGEEWWGEIGHGMAYKWPHAPGVI